MKKIKDASSSLDTWVRAGTLFALLVGTFGCGLGSSKDLAATSKPSSQNFDQAQIEFKEVPYGEAVGTVAVPSFQTALDQDIENLGITLAQSPNVRNVSTGVSGNLPEIGVAGNLNTNAVFAFSKLYLASCTDKCDVDRGSTTQPNRLCTFDMSKGYKDGANDAAWTQSIQTMAALFWGRKTVTPTEMATLLTLRDEAAAEAPASLAAQKQTNNSTNVIRATFAAVCATMKLAPDAIAQ